MSLARRHRERMLAQVAAAQAASDPVGLRSGAAASEYELMRARLGVDLRRLQDLQSIEKKIALKRELLPAYHDWVAGVLEADAGVQDDIVVQTMIWGIDTGDFAWALPLCRYVVSNGLALPERFDRTAPTLICEEIAEAALKSFGQGENFDIDVLRSVAALVEREDIFDQVRAKLEKATGLLLANQAEAIDPAADGPAGARNAGLQLAVDHLKRALALDPNAGVKKRIERLERMIAKGVTEGAN